MIKVASTQFKNNLKRNTLLVDIKAIQNPQFFGNSAKF